jgi:hypothetical protein
VGVNGLPEPEDLLDDDFGEDLAESPTIDWESNNDKGMSVAAWAAFAAVVISSLFAVRTAVRHARRKRNRADNFAAWGAERATRDPDVTPPHGDKLMSRAGMA